MRVHETLDNLYLDALALIFEEGHEVPSRDGHSQEFMGYVGRLLDPRANFIFNPVRALSASYAAAEILWYLMGTDDTTMLQTYAPQYKRFTEDGTFAWGAYGSRWQYSGDFSFQRAVFQDEHPEMDGADFAKVHGPSNKPVGQLEFLLWALMRQPNTRQAVVTMWSPGDLVHSVPVDRKDLPCTLTLNFLVRANKLYLTATMRSNDIWLGLPYDIWAFTTLQALLAEALGLDLGWYQHQAMSLHVYDRNESKALEAANVGNFKTGSLEYTPHGWKWNDLLAMLPKFEAFQREIHGYSPKHPFPPDSLPAQLLAMAASKFDPQTVAKKYISNSIMAGHIA